jgi:hypothetical protein
MGTMHYPGLPSEPRTIRGVGTLAIRMGCEKTKRHHRSLCGEIGELLEIMRTLWDGGSPPGYSCLREIVAGALCPQHFFSRSRDVS